MKIFLIEWMQPAFWASVLQVIWINILLSGDNVVVIALACRALPPRQRLWGMVLGAGIAVVLSIIFTGIVSVLMLLPYLKLIGGVLLLYIAIRLTVPADRDREGDVAATDNLWEAVRAVALADIVMSFDNVIAIAAIAKGNVALVIVGLSISVPLIVAGAAMLLALLNRFPILVWGGSALLGWIAGGVIATDPAVEAYAGAHLGARMADQIETATALTTAIAVVVIGGFYRIRHPSAALADCSAKSLPNQGSGKPVDPANSPAGENHADRAGS